jgi:choline dehydrogenase
VDQTRASSEVAFLQTSLDKPNYIVYQSTLGKRILFDDDKNAIDVEVDLGGRQFALMANKEVIVSSGAIQSLHLLMVSEVGPAAISEKHNITVVADRPGVGQNTLVSMSS